MTSSTLFLLNLLMRVAHFWDILTSIFTDGTFKNMLTLGKKASVDTWSKTTSLWHLVQSLLQV